MEILLEKALFQGGVMKTCGQYPITLVTAYFDVGGRPQHPEWENPYPRWIRNFLPFVRWPLVIFCDEQSLDILKEVRGDKPAVWHVTRLEEFYAYKYLDDLKRLPFPAERAEAYIARSLIYHEKHHFLRQALSENPFGSEMLFWCDIGQFRYDPGAPWWSLLRWAFRLFEDIEWPNLEVCRALPQDKTVLMRICRHDASRVRGTFFGGAMNPSRRWCDAYYWMLEKRKQKGGFIDYEEFVMQSCLKRRPELVHMILPGLVPFPGMLKGRGYWLDSQWYFLKGGRFPWKYACRRLFAGSGR